MSFPAKVIPTRSTLHRAGRCCRHVVSNNLNYFNDSMKLKCTVVIRSLAAARSTRRSMSPTWLVSYPVKNCTSGDRLSTVKVVNGGAKSSVCMTSLLLPIPIEHKSLNNSMQFTKPHKKPVISHVRCGLFARLPDGWWTTLTGDDGRPGCRLVVRLSRIFKPPKCTI